MQKLQAIIIALVLLGACATENEPETTVILAQYPHYENFETLAVAATAIVRAEILDERTEYLNIPFVINSIRVTEVFDGTVDVGDILEVSQMRDLHGRLHFEIDADLVLFLSSLDNFATPAGLLNPYQAAFQISPADELVALSPQSDLTILLADLRIIVE
ncbi:MAG: hypothetical protein FWG65_00740 [Turicibacter sp.]|nr:hypothetical protein [Turicibacter sp.]